MLKRNVEELRKEFRQLFETASTFRDEAVRCIEQIRNNNNVIRILKLQLEKKGQNGDHRTA